MDKQTVMKIPETILNTIIEKKDDNYISKIDPNDLFNESNISCEAMDILCYLDYTYWMNKEKKDEIDAINIQKSVEIENKKNGKYNKQIFNKNNKEEYKSSSYFDDRTTKECANDNVYFPAVVKHNWINVLIDKLKDFFKLKNRK